MHSRTHAALYFLSLAQNESPCIVCNAAVFLPVLQDAYPQRLKQIHLFNVPNYIDKLLTLFRSLMKEKMRSRVSVCDLSLCILLQRRRPRFSLSLYSPPVFIGIYIPLEGECWVHQARARFFCCCGNRAAPSPPSIRAPLNT